MKLTFRHEFDHPLQHVLRVVFEDAARVGTLSVPAAAAISERHVGRIPGHADLPLATGGVDFVYHYEWDPDGLKRSWRIEPLSYRNRIRECHGVTVYKSSRRGDKWITTRDAELSISVDAGPLSSVFERRIGAGLRRAADSDHRRTVELLEGRQGGGMFPMGDDNQEAAVYRIRDLAAFWLGTCATASCGGFFIGRSEKGNLLALGFALVIGVLFAVAFMTTSVARKNVFGLFLGIFNFFFWVGWYGAQRWPR